MVHPDFRDLLAEFVRCEVRFVLIGGYAVGHHAKPRATKDMDLLVAGDDRNLFRVSQALEAFGAPGTLEDLLTNKRAAGRDQDRADAALLERVLLRRTPQPES